MFPVVKKLAEINNTWIIHLLAKMLQFEQLQPVQYIVEIVYGQRLATQFMFQVDAALQKVRRNALLIQTYLDPSNSKTSIV